MKRLMMALLAVSLAVSVLAAESEPTPATIDDVLEELRELRGEPSTVLGLSAQIAIVMTVPVAATRCPGYRVDGARPRCPVDAYLLGSTIEGFPMGTVLNRGYISDRRLPAGTYLVELHQPRSGKLICHGSNSAAYQREPRSNRLFTRACPHLSVGTVENRLDSGSRIYTVDPGKTLDLNPVTRIPPELFGSNEEHRHYTGSIKITRLR